MKRELSSGTIAQIEKDYAEAKEFFGPRTQEIEAEMADLAGLEKVFMQYLYAYTPLSDVGAYEFEVIRSYASHALFLLDECPCLEDIPEAYFLNYVLSHRINSEDLTDCRRFFYEQVCDRIRGMSVEEAVIEINNWCYEGATYRSTSVRTASPLTVWKGGIGRCGEESTLFVSALRSVGIPARQIYVPRWSHSDSNHAWVEVWLGNEWSYTGACEPKPVMLNGWFTDPASRAMIVHYRTVAEFDVEPVEIVERDGVMTAVNDLDLYARGKYLTVGVVNEQKEPIEGAKVRYLVVNAAEFYPVSVLETNEQGQVTVKLGLGQVMVEVLYEGGAMTRLVDNRTEDQVEFVWRPEALEDGWRSYQLTAPEAHAVMGVELTPEQERMQDDRNAASDVIRNSRVRGYYDEAFASQFASHLVITDTLEKSGGNFGEIRSFLENQNVQADIVQKNTLLGTLASKDCRDIKAETLADWAEVFCCEQDWPDDIFVPYILNGRAGMEMSSPYRAHITELFGDKKSFWKEKPSAIWEWICDEIRDIPEREYATIVSHPIAVLNVRAGTKASRNVLFVSVCRTFGIPARLDPVYHEAQYYQDGGFVFADCELQKRVGAELVLRAGSGVVPVYEQNVTIGIRQEDGSYVTMELEDAKFTEGQLELKLLEGEYRVVTCDRLPDGSVAGQMLCLYLKKGEQKEVELKMSGVTAADYVVKRSLPAFEITSETGETIDSAQLCDSPLNALLFVGPGKEPTEHLFLELLEATDMWKFPAVGLRLIQRKEGAEDRAAWKKVLAAYPQAEVVTGDIEKAVEAIGIVGEIDSGKLPVIAVVDDEHNLIHCVSGYQVGSVDALFRILREYKK